MAIKASAAITLSSIRDLQSCTRYYLLQSSTSAKPAKPTAKPPGGNWVTAEPSYTAGSTNSLYFCDLNVFSDGDYAYSDVSLSSSYEAAKAAYNKAVTAEETAGQATLSGGGTTGAKAVYINATTRCTTHIAAGNMVQMVYRSNVTIGTATYTGWWISRALNDNTYDRIRFNNAIKAKTAISASRLIVGDSGGFFHLAAGSVFDVDKPILWAVSAITAAATGTNNYLSYPSCTLRNNTTSTWTATQYETLYLAGTLEGSVFTVASENWLTTAPSSATQTYISLGYMYSTYQMYFYPEHPMYRLVNGILTAISTLAYEAQVAAESAQATADAARADFRRVVRVDDDGLHVGDNLSNGEVLIDSESVNVVLGGKKYSKFAGSYVQFGNYQLRRSSDGGLVFKLA